MTKTLFHQGFGYFLHSAVIILIMLLFPALPPFGTITPLGMQLLGIFIALIYGWTFAGLIWPSILGLIAMGCTEGFTVNQVFMQGFGHQTVLFLFFLYIFCGAVDQSGVTTYIGRLIITRKICLGPTLGLRISALPVRLSIRCFSQYRGLHHFGLENSL